MEEAPGGKNRQADQDGLPAGSQDNFSYMALLRGDIDISSLTDTTNQFQGDTRSFSSSANNDTGKMVVGTRFQDEACTTEEMAHQFRADQDVGKNTEGASTSKKFKAQDADTERDDWNEIVDDNPWDTNLFDDMHLDEIEEEYNANEEANRHETDHTWNLDAQNDNLETDVDTSDSSSEPMAASKEKASGEIDEEDVENFLEDEKEASEQPSPNTGVSAELVPEKGMQFKSRNEAQQFLNNYSFAAGFSIAVVSVYRTTSKKRNNEVTRATIKCNKHGHNTADENEQVLGQRQGTVFVRTDCKVEMVISEKSGVWRITNLKLEHNHPLDPGSRFFRCHVHMTAEEKAIIRTMKQCNIPTRNIVSVLAHLRGGGMEQLSYNKRKVCNYGTTVNRELKNSDLMKVQAWFNKKRAENPGFYYSMELDSKSKVRSVFWSDARARQNYDLFGDCISFDTTFLTNKYNLPFAPFVGISPHAKTYLFACAFIVNETALTFEWLFKQFLLAMGDRPPKSIITYQDKAMENAIAAVFPNATHMTCLFHLKKKCDDKNGTTFQANEGLYEEMQDI